MKMPAAMTAHESRAAKTLREIFDSGRPLTYIRSSEEQRVARVLREVSAHSASARPSGPGASPKACAATATAAQAGTLAPRGALDFIAAHAGPGIFHLKDFHEPLRESPEIRRRLRDLYESCRDQRKFVVISSPVRVDSGGGRAQHAVSRTAAAGRGRAGRVSCATN